MAMSLCTFVGCGKQNREENNSSIQIEDNINTTKTEDQLAAEDKKEQGEEVSKVTGVLESKKDFMFIVTDEEQNSYAFSFEETPEGLDTVEIGDLVNVKYTGVVSEIDPFTGKIILVEKK